MRRPAAILRFTSLLLAAAGLSACTIDSPKSRYILAERLWTDQNYGASVTEFEKVIAKDPHGALGLQALFRAAMTQTIYLGQHAAAVEKFHRYIERADEPESVWEAQKQIGEVLFAKTEQYDAAIRHYRILLKMKPAPAEAAEFLYRIGRSHFFLYQFEAAIQAYQELLKRFSKDPHAEIASLEIGHSHFTKAGLTEVRSTQGVESYQEAMDAFQEFIRKYPQSPKVSEANFGIASCLEAMDQLDEAYHAYEALRGKYPSPQVIEIKLVRIRERKEQRNR
jgi:TolA-binding protein